MASAKIIHQWPDGTATEMVVTVKADGPDALDECVRRVTEPWRECTQTTEDES